MMYASALNLVSAILMCLMLAMESADTAVIRVEMVQPAETQPAVMLLMHNVGTLYMA